MITIITNLASATILFTLLYSVSTSTPINYATKYLREYRYLTNEQRSFSEAIRRFQLFADLPVTGKLDAATLSKMHQRRCGNPDVGKISIRKKHMSTRRNKRYALEGSFWSSNNITYRIARYTSSMNRQKVRYILKKAFKTWAEHSNLRFIHKTRGRPHIEISFLKKAHGDDEPFDGQGQILAHAFFPRFGGEIHFDDDEWWSPIKYSSQGIDLYAVAVHEIGHALGLKHSENHHAIMAPFYQSYKGDTIHLHKDDIHAISQLYGTWEDEDTSSNEDTKEQPDICKDASIDAITIIGNGTAYAFKGFYYWRLNKHGYDKGYPRRIIDDWNGIPGPINAAVTDRDGDTFVFEEMKYWVLDKDGNVRKGYPRLISKGLKDMPTYIDAAMMWSYDYQPYFFRNDKYWKYSRGGMPRTYPRSVRSIFKGFKKQPQKIDAAVQWYDGKSYVFTGRDYYRLNEWKVLHAAHSYPRDTANWWFGCDGLTHSQK